MTPPRSLVGTITDFRWLRRFRDRALVFGALILLCLVLAVFPQRYRAVTTFTPADPQMLGFSGTLGQLGAQNSIFGNQAAIEIAIRVGDSIAVRDIVIQRLNLQKRTGIEDRTALHRWLDRNVTVRSLRGGIVSVEMVSRDRDLAERIVGAYSNATRERLAEINRVQTAYKRNVLKQLVGEAGEQLGTAQAAYDQFRLKNRTPTPSVAFSTVSQRIPMLEGMIKAKQVEMATAREMYGEENNVIRQMKVEMATLQKQLTEIRATSAEDQSSVGGAVSESSKLFKLEREQTLARTLYDNYLRYLQGTMVEDLTSTANIRVLEPPFIDTDRQYRWPAIAAAIAALLLWGAIEFYRLRPPLGARLATENGHG